jgi:hypothetical protein
MELEYFTSPDVSMETHRQWVRDRIAWWRRYANKPEGTCLETNKMGTSVLFPDACQLILRLFLLHVYGCDCVLFVLTLID